MDWARILAYVTGAVDRELLARTDINTVDAHAKVLEASGEVSIARFGAPNPGVKSLQEQLKDGTRTNLIIVYKRSNGFHALQSQIRAIRVATPTFGQNASAPV